MLGAQIPREQLHSGHHRGGNTHRRADHPAGTTTLLEGASLLSELIQDGDLVPWLRRPKVTPYPLLQPGMQVTLDKAALED